VEDWTGGRLEDDEHARGLCTLALGIALVLLSVALGFDSAWAAAMVFLSLPLALAGVMAAFWTTGTAFTREAADGVILVVGLAVNQAILLVDAALERRRANVRLGARAGLSAPPLLRAALDRSAMIVLITASTLTSLGAAGRAAGARAGPARPGPARPGPARGA
jgi:multidrug efflux pump subunit AcrB